MNIKNLANMITMVRIVGALTMIFCENYTAAFFVVFTLCGVTDIIDGFVARVTNTMSEFGARLDSVADLLFYTILGVKILPDLIRILPLWMWFIVGGILLTRIICYIITAIRFKCLAAMHTYMNKLTGFACFTIPYSIVAGIFAQYSILISIVAVWSTLEELIMTLMMKGEYTPKKTIFAFLSQKKIAV